MIILTFETRQAFRDWLSKHHPSEAGVWLRFGKSAQIKTLKASEALEEALCFGWIDGQMKSLDEHSYIKYFALRRKNSKWSAKNKALCEKLIKEGLMSSCGFLKIEEAKQNGQWDQDHAPMPISDEQLDEVAKQLKENTAAYHNFIKMPQSVKKTYARAYFDAKTEAGRKRRLEWMLDRLAKNLKPM